MHEIQEKATTHNVFMKIIRPWPGRSGYLEKFSDVETIPHSSQRRTLKLFPQVNLTRTDLDILGDIAEALAKCDCLCTCNFLRRVQSEVTKIVEYQEER